MNPELRRQIPAVMRLELRKTFFARRGLWIYLLAFAPVFLYLINSVYVGRERARLTRIAAEHPVATQDLDNLRTGLTRDQVTERLGAPYDTRTFNFGGRRQRGERRFDRYTDGATDVTLTYANDQLDGIRKNPPPSLARSTLGFAGVFDLYFLRLAVFFGCVGVFMNLFRGEMLDKSLHFYLLAPIPREALLAGKYLAGLIATVVIFSTSTALQLVAMLRQFDSATVDMYLMNGGWTSIGWYLAVTVLACIGYGSIFLTAGLLFRNPIVPAALVLVWESANIFVPLTLKKISMIYYLQSLCPVPPPTDSNMTPLLALLVSAFEPTGKTTAILTILLLTAGMLVMAGWLARKLEINYSAD